MLALIVALPSCVLFGTYPAAVVVAVALALAVPPPVAVTDTPLFVLLNETLEPDRLAEGVTILFPETLAVPPVTGKNSVSFASMEALEPPAILHLLTLILRELLQRTCFQHC